MVRRIETDLFDGKWHFYTRFFMAIIVSFKIRFHNTLLKELAKVLAERRVIEGMVKAHALGILHIKYVRGYSVQDSLTLWELQK